MGPQTGQVAPSNAQRDADRLVWSVSSSVHGSHPIVVGSSCGKSRKVGITRHVHGCGQRQEVDGKVGIAGPFHPIGERGSSGGRRIPGQINLT